MRTSVSGLLLLSGFLLVCSSATAQPMTASAQHDELQRLCGRVIDVTCDAANKHALALMLDPAVLVLVTAGDVDGFDRLRQAAQGVLFRKVCLVGHLSHKGGGFTVAEFVAAPASEIEPQEERPPTTWEFPGVYRFCDKGVLPPKVTRERRPQYTREALEAKIQGAVWVQAVVTPAGRPDNLRVVRSLDSRMGLDRAAIDAVKNWRFKPATKDGKPVPVIALIELTFTLK